MNTRLVIASFLRKDVRVRSVRPEQQHVHPNNDLLLLAIEAEELEAHIHTVSDRPRPQQLDTGEDIISLPRTATWTEAVATAMHST